MASNRGLPLGLASGVPVGVVTGSAGGGGGATTLAGLAIADGATHAYDFQTINDLIGTDHGVLRQGAALAASTIPGCSGAVTMGANDAAFRISVSGDWPSRSTTSTIEMVFRFQGMFGYQSNRCLCMGPGTHYDSTSIHSQLTTVGGSWPLIQTTFWSTRNPPNLGGNSGVVNTIVYLALGYDLGNTRYDAHWKVEGDVSASAATSAVVASGTAPAGYYYLGSQYYDVGQIYTQYNITFHHLATYSGLLTSGQAAQRIALLGI